MFNKMYCVLKSYIHEIYIIFFNSNFDVLFSKERIGGNAYFN